MHDVVTDTPLAAQADDRGALRFEQLAAEPLVIGRALLDLPVVIRGLPGLEPRAPEVVEAAHALRRLRPNPILLEQLLEPLERGVGGEDAGARVLLRRQAVFFEVEVADQEGQGQALDQECPQED